MDLRTYATEADLHKDHWWFVVRRILFASEIKKLGLAKEAVIVDLGTSAGTNLKMLSEMQFQNIRGLDFSEVAIQYCAKEGYPPVTQGDICDLPFEDESIDLVLATDIIEHVDDDAKAVSEIRRVLKPDGHALITVPAFMMLWGPNDDMAHHKRRYKAKEVNRLLEQQGLELRRNYYFNFILFLPILVVRFLLKSLKPSVESENNMTPGLLNKILKGLFHLDVVLASRLRPPFGVSYLALVKKVDLNAPTT